MSSTNRARPTRLARRLLAPLLLAAACGAAAHDYWLEPEGTEWLLWRGHRFSSHAGESLVPYDPAIVRTALCAGTDGRPRPVTPGRSYPVRIPGPCAAVVVEADSGVWTQTLTGTTNQPPDGRLGVLRAWRAIEGVKLITAWSPALAAPLSQALEITSSGDPLRLAPDDKLRLLVTWQGRPRAGVTVAYDGEPRGITGADGRINLRVRHGGMQVIAASVDEPGPEPGVGKLVRSTTLLFNLP